MDRFHDDLFDNSHRRREQGQHSQRNQPRTSNSQPVASTSKVTLSGDTPVIDISDDDDEEDDDEADDVVDDDATDDDDELSHSHGQLEDVCLVCGGACHCGGAAGRGVYANHEPLKIKFKLSTKPTTPAGSGTSSAPVSNGAASTVSTHQRTRPLSSSDDEADATPKPLKKKAKQQLPQPPPGQVVVVAAPAPVAAAKARPKQHKPAQASRSNSPAPTSNGLPSRMSLRQVLAMSVREHSQSPAPSAAGDDERRAGPMPAQQLSDAELSSDEDEAMEKAEERALRAEFETASSEDDQSDVDGDDDDDDFDRRSRKSEMSVGAEWDAYEKAQARLSKKYDEGSSPGLEEDLEFEDDELGVTQLPTNGGKGVITWSDYDSIHSSDEDDDSDSEPTAVNLAGEFEDELEELLALSEAVVGPVRDEELEMGEIWFEQVTDSDERDSGSTADDESSGDDGDEQDVDDTEDEADPSLIRAQPVVVMEGAWTNSYSSRRGQLAEDSADDNASSAGDSSAFDDEMYFHDPDGGETTDSLDSDDHVGLVRFGIEVDSDSSQGESDYDLQALLAHAPGTASLADVQAPTSADLASLPAYLFSGPGGVDRSGMLLDLQNLDQDPEQTILAAAHELGVGPATAARILEGVNRSFLKGKTNSSLRSLEDDEAGSVEGAVVPRGPVMGAFAPKDSGRTAEVSVVIDESDLPAPSPFSTLKKNKRLRSSLAEGTPSRRSRAPSSKISTTSLTDGSVAGETVDLASPFTFPPEAEEEEGEPSFDLDQLVDFEPDSVSSSDSSGPGRLLAGIPPPTPAADGIRDLSRWNRIPIGAFRSSMKPALFGEHAHMASPAHGSVVAGVNSEMGQSLYHLPIAGLAADKVLKRESSSSRSPSGSRRAIERRMLTSPVFGPVDGAGTPQSRKLRRKDKKKQKIAAANGPDHPSIRPSSRRGSVAGSKPQDLPSHALGGGEWAVEGWSGL